MWYFVTKLMILRREEIMLDQPMNRGELLEQYASGPDTLNRIVNGLSRIDLEKKFSPEEWSIRDIIHHIVDGDDIWIPALKPRLETRKEHSPCNVLGQAAIGVE
jgi:uncharacterized damage-inducible protein DinB